MIYLKPKTVEEMLKNVDENRKFFIFCGGTDLTLKLKNGDVCGVVDISSLDEFNHITIENNTLKIGALTTINTILEDENIKEHLPILHEASKEFASHQIRNIATIGGNIANDSPVADMIAPLLVLESSVTLLSVDGERTIPLDELFDGFKSLTIKNEVITSINIPLKNRQSYYRKVGARAKLNISKLSLAMVKTEDNFYLSGASLNPYIKRFFNVEKLLESGEFSSEMIFETLKKDISPSGSFRSTKEYRFKVLVNMIEEGISSTQFIGSINSNHNKNRFKK